MSEWQRGIPSEEGCYEIIWPGRPFTPEIRYFMRNGIKLLWAVEGGAYEPVDTDGHGANHFQHRRTDTRWRTYLKKLEVQWFSSR